MENKYYTPTLKDLHYGFEFEYKSKEDSWVQVTLDTWNSPSKENHLKHFTEYDLLRNLNYQDMACKYEDLTCIRIKYLDQSDIESLGWKLSNQYDGAWWEWDKLILDAEEMWHPLGNWKYRLSLDENMKVHIDGRNPSNGGQTKKFNGTIKNKSELIKLMKQLDIK